jgi:hypothetical protein
LRPFQRLDPLEIKGGTQREDGKRQRNFVGIDADRRKDAEDRFVVI